MDSRNRILVVEDVENQRETLVATLRDEGWRVDGAGTLQAATEAVHACTYHVALVDINLADARDTSNRDGILVLRLLAGLNEGTQPVVLSGTRERTLVRDLLQDGLTPTFIFKDEVSEKGSSFLVSEMRDAIAASTAARALSWDALVRTIAHGLGEQAFVSECLHFLSFKGGFENLEKSLLSGCSQLAPLLPESGTTSAMARQVVPEVFNGRFWSKSQGQAIELLLYGGNAPRHTIESKWDIAHRTALYSHSKGDLSILALDCPGMTRLQFTLEQIQPT